MLKRGILLILIILMGSSVLALQGDFDDSGCVDFEDFLLFAEHFDAEEGDVNYDTRFDLETGDGRIGVEDFLLFAEYYGKCKEKSVRTSKVLIVTYDRKPELEYKQGEKKILDTMLEPSLDDPNKYLVYILTTPDFPKFEINLLLFKNLRLYYWGPDEEYFHHVSFEPKFVSTTNRFDGKWIKDNKIGNLYAIEFDYSDLKGYPDYWITINLLDYRDYERYFSDGFHYPYLTFDIIDPTNYDLNEACSLIQESKYSEEESINLAFIGDVYSDEELVLYAYDVESALDAFLTDPTIVPYRNRMNIYRANYVSREGKGDLDCRYGKGCYAFYEGFGWFKLVGAPERLLCCNANKVESKIKQLCGDRPYVMNVINNEERWAGAVLSYPDNPLLFAGRLIEIFRNYVLGKKEVGITAQNQAGRTVSSKTIFSHEVGHLVAGLSDYYEIDPDCEHYKCKMCDSHYSYSDEGLCYDKQGMVKWLNQWCKAKVKIFRDKDTFKEYNPFWARTRLSPYPNPFNPLEQNTTIEFNVKYEKGEDPCYVLMNVYNVNGQLIDIVVSEEPLEDGNYALKWDGRNLLDQEIVASGVYIYEVTIGESRDTIKGTVLK